MPLDNYNEHPCRDANWRVYYTEDDDGSPTMSTDRIQIMLLMDIREELRELNRTLNCHRFQAIPDFLARLDARAREFVKLKPWASKKSA